MKTAFTLFAICVFSISARAQDWVHQGSKWHYYWVTLGGPGYDEIIYRNDSILEGKPCHKLSVMRYSANYIGAGHYFLDTTLQSPLYTYSNSDTTFFYYSALNKWQAVYFFGAHAGDSITLPNDHIYSTYYDTFVHTVVDSTGTMIINNDSLRFYTFHLTDSCAIDPYFRGEVVERLGIWDNDMTPFWHCITDDTYYSFCSYEDDSFVLYQPMIGCTDLPTGIQETQPAQVSIYPNPAQDEINVHMNQVSGNMQLSISDISGRALLHQAVETTNEKVSTGDLANGLYLLTISEVNKPVIQKKLLINH